MSLPSPLPVKPSWTTPRFLQSALFAIWGTAVLFFFVALATVRVSRSLVQTIGKDAVPSILSAQRLKVSLSDLDANVVNELLVPPGSSASSIKGYVERRQEIADSLIRATENITYGDLERKPITDLTNTLSAFERLAIKARTLYQRGDNQGAIATYRDALGQLHNALLPAADALAKANTDALNRREAELSGRILLMTALTVLTGAVLCAVLLATQVFLSQRMRRTLNPSLLGATFLTVLALVLVVRSIGATREQVHVARSDAFTSLSALWQARAIAYDANSDESRWLFDREHRPELEKAFFEKTAQLLKLPTGQSYPAMATATSGGALPAGTQGFFADALGNITFAGEQNAAQEMVKTFGVYYAKDERIRSLENAGQHAEAVRFCISMASGDSNWAYAQFDQALEKTIGINQEAFDKAIETGFLRLRGYDIGLPLAALFVGVFALIGIRPRLREYDL